MKILCQQDPKWAALHLGDSPLTIGRYGCTTTCISMLSDYFGCFKDPAAIANTANNLLKFTPDGLIIWQTLNLPPMKFEKRLYGRQDAEIMTSLKDPNKAVILEVNHSHWVVATGKVPFLNIYRIVDTWHGDRSSTARYKNNVTGSAHFYKSNLP